LGIARQGQGADLSLPVTGNLIGTVVDSSGAPQIGATVQLFNKYQQVLAKAVTAAGGQFAFAGLPVDLYSVRVSVPTFLPISRDRIAIKPGLDSVLQIHLATLFSTMELTYAIPNAAMTEDWKWVLRSSPATRPINRVLGVELAQQPSTKIHSQIFSDTRAMLTVSGGDGGLIDSDSATADLGTGFALTTNLLGKNQLQFAGSFGSAQQIGPVAMGLCAIYSRNETGGFAAAPEVTLTVSQLGHFGTQPGSGEFAMPNGLASPLAILRTMSLSVYQTADPLDNVHLEFGMTGESVDYGQSTSRVSPFARLTTDIGTFGQIVAAYSDGARPDELTAHQIQKDTEVDVPRDEGLINAVNTLSRLPEISNRNGRLELEHTQNYELGYNKTVGARTYAASAFYESVTNGRLNVAGDLSDLSPDDLLWDGTSMTSTYNIGHYRRRGYIASADQHIGDSLEVAIAYGRMGGFTASSSGLADSWGVQQKFLTEADHNVASANVRVRAPITGTQITTSYGWSDTGAVIPRHAFTTQSMYIAPGLNIAVHQPLPSPFGMPGHFELTADMRNLLAQGYVPLAATGGHQMLIVQSPRAIRGGLNFVF